MQSRTILYQFASLFLFLASRFNSLGEIYLHIFYKQRICVQLHLIFSSIVILFVIDISRLTKT